MFQHKVIKPWYIPATHTPYHTPYWGISSASMHVNHTLVSEPRLLDPYSDEGSGDTEIIGGSWIGAGLPRGL